MGNHQWDGGGTHAANMTLFLLWSAHKFPPFCMRFAKSEIISNHRYNRYRSEGTVVCGVSSEGGYGGLLNEDVMIGRSLGMGWLIRIKKSMWWLIGSEDVVAH